MPNAEVHRGNRRRPRRSAGMSLLNPTVGDLCDRLTILALKRLHGTAAGKDVSHFNREWAGLLTKIHGRTLNGAWFEHLLDLGAVNAELWVLTDDMRTLAEQHRSVTTPDSSGLTGHFSGPRVLEQAGPVGIAILRLNDRRAELIQTINELCGDADGREKL